MPHKWTEKQDTTTKLENKLKASLNEEWTPNTKSNKEP